jgi:hypothetical protein
MYSLALIIFVISQKKAFEHFLNYASIIGRSFTNFVFFMLIVIPRWLPLQDIVFTYDQLFFLLPGERYRLLRASGIVDSINYLTAITTSMGPSWLWSYGSWIYNYLCKQCLSPLKLWVWTPFMGEVYLIQYYVIKFVSDKSAFTQSNISF